MTFPLESVGAVLVAGGAGSRMGGATPKQFLLLKGKAIALHSLELFLQSSSIDEIAIVCSLVYQPLFENAIGDCKKVSFALPGIRRQDSVYNGVRALSERISYVCIHDAARPFIAAKELEEVIAAGRQWGAATLAIPVKGTIKQVNQELFVDCTPARSLLFEAQTPQVLQKQLLLDAFDKCYADKLNVTDDVSLAELIGRPVKIVQGSYKNIKITTPEDLTVAQLFV